MKKRLFVDMDGTLAVFYPVNRIETLYQRGYFLNLEPMGGVLTAVRHIVRQNSNIEVNILSAHLSDSHYSYTEKMVWLNQYLPEVEYDRRVLVPIGCDKRAAVKGGLQPGDYLLDDYTKNLASWEPARGIKLLNGINHTRGTWQGSRIRYDKPPHVLARTSRGLWSLAKRYATINLKIRIGKKGIMTDEPLARCFLRTERSIAAHGAGSDTLSYQALPFVPKRRLFGEQAPLKPH